MKAQMSTGKMESPVPRVMLLLTSQIYVRAKFPACLRTERPFILPASDRYDFDEVKAVV